MDSYDKELIKEHYEKQARLHGDSPSSTMEDEIIRERETNTILEFFAKLPSDMKNRQLRVLDLGCGNGYTLSLLLESYPRYGYWGQDFSEELLSIARKRLPEQCEIVYGDALDLPFEDGFFDVVYTQRCLINVMNDRLQVQAAQEIARVMSDGGLYLMLEAFSDGLSNLNKARQECDLDEISEAHHNTYLDKETFFPAVQGLFSVINLDEPDARGEVSTLAPNFLSSHYYVSRVLFPFIAGGKWQRNSEFAKFFSFLPPSGNYSPVQVYVLQKLSS